MSAPTALSAVRRHMRRVPSHELITLTASQPFVEQGWVFDLTKPRGHLVSRAATVSRSDLLRAAAASAFLPSSNEFMNCLTEVLPAIFFSAAAIALAVDIHAAGANDEMATLRQSVLGTLLGTILQHLCSLFAHAGHRLSARLSHSIWFVDYAGILLNVRPFAGVEEPL